MVADAAAAPRDPQPAAVARGLVPRSELAPDPDRSRNTPSPVRRRGLHAWQYVPESRRDLRLDFLRGYCAFAMVVDHLGGASFLYPLTGGNRFFVSAAEGFIFLSGLLVGFIYGPRIAQRGLEEVQLHVLRRAATLYAVTLGLTFTFVGLSRLSAMPWLQDVEPLSPDLVASLITLHHTYYLVDVMLLYTLVLAISPLALLLLHTGKTWVVLLGSLGCWLAYQWFPDAVRVPWTIVNNETFQITAWQMWFFAGMVVGYHRAWIWKRLAKVPLFLAMPLLVAAAAALIYLRLVDGAPLAGLLGAQDGPAAIDLLFGKDTVRPGRLVAFAVFFPLFYLLLTYCWRPLERALGWLMIPFGQNALYVYALHLFAVYLSALLLPYVPGFDRFNPWHNTPVHVVSLFTIWLMVKRQVLFDVIPR